VDGNMTTADIFGSSYGWRGCTGGDSVDERRAGTVVADRVAELLAAHLSSKAAGCDN
jgi:hypothetical protein